MLLNNFKRELIGAVARILHQMNYHLIIIVIYQGNLYIQRTSGITHGKTLNQMRACRNQSIWLTTK